MSNLKNIGNKLFKESTELKSHDVELGIVQDLMDAIRDHKKQRSIVDNSIDRWYNDLFKVRDKFPKVINENKKFKTATFILEKALEGLEEVAKEVGVNPNSLDGYKLGNALLNTSKDVDDEFKEAKKLEGRIG